MCQLTWVCFCPGITQNFGSNWGITFLMVYCYLYKAYSWYKWKIHLLYKKNNSKCHIMGFYWKVQKWSFIRVFIFLLEFQLTRTNVIVLILKFIFDETLQAIYWTKSILKYSNLPPIPLFCLKKPIPSIIM